jgi:penicillin-binding protein 1A
LKRFKWLCPQLYEQFLLITAIPRAAVRQARFGEESRREFLQKNHLGLRLISLKCAVTLQGASTITMQVARNFYLSAEKTFTRKLYEILLALKIEAQLSKDQILELYMNQIYLGQRAYGFASASEIYFGKPKDITPARRRCWPACRRRRRATTRSPTRSARSSASSTSSTGCSKTDSSPKTSARLRMPRCCTYRAPTESPIHAEYVAEMARQLVFAQYGDEAYTRGLNVTLTVDSTDQLVAYHALRRGIMDFERRQQFRGPEGYVDLPADPKAVDAARRRGAGRPPRQRRPEGRRRAGGVAQEGA